MFHSWRDLHIRTTIKSLLKTLYATAGVFVAFFVIFHIAGSFYTSHISEKALNDFKDGIYRDTQYFKKQGDEISKNSSIIEGVLSNNRDRINQLLQYERTKRSIGLLSVADSNGLIITRTFNKNNYGDNVFLTTPAGRVVQSGKPIQSIELTSFGNQLFLTTARPIIHEGNMIGALFANNFLDDAYSKRFKNLYLPKDSQVIFYTKKYGVFGSSFSDPENLSIVNSYFNTGSDWIVNGTDNTTVVFPDDTIYLVRNIDFPGIDNNHPGGALVFVPRNDISNLANLITALLTILTFVSISFIRHLRMTKDEKSWRYYILLLIFTIPVFISAYYLLNLQNLGRVVIKNIPYTVYNSTLGFIPETSIYNVGFEQHVSVVLETGGEAVNAIQLSFKFDPEKVEIESIEPATSTCSYVIENNINKDTGEVDMSCVMLNGQGITLNATVADIYFVPKKPGSFSLSFDKENTKVLANDGLGTDVLRMSQDSSYRADYFNFSAINSSSTDDGMEASSTKRSFFVYSPSHSNESRWYNSKGARFFWRGKPGAVYKYIFDSLPNTIPTNGHVTNENELNINVPRDGVYYFHLQLASGGPVAHYKILSDTTPPNINKMAVSEDNIFVGDVVRFLFEAEDTSSGIQRNYYVNIGNHLFLPVGESMFIPFVDEGGQNITLRVYDNAGNYAEASKFIDVMRKNNN